MFQLAAPTLPGGRGGLTQSPPLLARASAHKRPPVAPSFFPEAWNEHRARRTDSGLTTASAE